MITVTYSIIPDDVLAMNIYMAKHVSEIKKVRFTQRFVWPFMLIGIAVLVGFNIYIDHIFSIIFALFIVSLLYIIFFNILSKWFILYSVKKKMKHLFGVHFTVSINDEAFTSESNQGKIQINWPFLHAVEATNDHIFFFTNPKFAIIVPQRSFPDTKQYRNFVTLAQMYFRAAKVATPAAVEVGHPERPSY